MEQEGAGLADDELAQQRADDNGFPAPPTLELAGEGGGKRAQFITEEEIRSSEGEANFKPKQDRKGRPGYVIQVTQGTVMGWLLLRIRNLEAQLYSQEGLLAAAGAELHRLHDTYEPIPDAPPTERPSGLLVPPGAKAGLVVPK